MLVKLMARLQLLLKQMLQRMQLIKRLIIQYLDQAQLRGLEAIILCQMEQPLFLQEILRQHLIFPLLTTQVMSA